MCWPGPHLLHYAFVCGNNGPAVCPSATVAGVALHLCLAAPSPTHIHNPNPPTTPSFQLLSLNHTLQSTLVLSLHPALAFSAALQRTMQIQQACSEQGALRCIFLFHINLMDERFFCSPSYPIIKRGVSSERD